ncbi:damage-inducible protein CinA [Methylovorus sp. MM2]|uniref:CinA family protein n=1 Tax=Methylovorus sp. MM2 TaxID=1848038 RepID=UPI0007DEF427|nr:CinA family protein [Methylovorus sp. MM2]OAM51471.1 damage-inducible protein CinA [Methylovorus sp. MM2]
MVNDALLALANTLAKVLISNKRVLTLAESCTGGLASGLLTALPGSSAWFDSGYITYSNQAKVDMLGVSKDTLEKFGAVSEETAAEMAIGALNHSTGRANIAASITGIAGPSGGSKEKPVGTVCFAWAISNQPVTTQTKLFQGNRHEIRQQSIETLLNGLLTIQKTLSQD